MGPAQNHSRGTSCFNGSTILNGSGECSVAIMLKHGSLREKEAQVIILDCIIIMLQNFCHKLQIVLATLEPEACQLIHKQTPTFLEQLLLSILHSCRKNEISRLKQLVQFRNCVAQIAWPISKLRIS